VTTRAAAFSTRCNLSVTVLGAPARSVAAREFTTAEDVGVDEVGSSSPRRCERRGDPDSDTEIRIQTHTQTDRRTDMLITIPISDTFSMYDPSGNKVKSGRRY